MLWWTLGIALLLVVAAAFVLQRLYLRPWRELEHLLTRIGRGEQPPTFLLGGTTRARRVGLALEQLLARQRELDRQVSKDAAEVRAVLAALTAGLNAENAEERIRLVAVKLRNMAKSDSMRHYFVDIAAAGSNTVLLAYDFYFEIPGRETVWLRMTPTGSSTFNAALKRI